MYTQVAEKWLAQQPKLTPLQREFLEKALAFYQQFAAERDTDPRARLDAVLARNRVAAIHEALGETDRAAASYRQALEELEDLSALRPDDAKGRAVLAETLAQLGEHPPEPQPIPRGRIAGETSDRALGIPRRPRPRE